MPARRHPRVLTAVIATAVVASVAITAGLLVPALRSPINIIRPDAAAPTWAEAAALPPRVKHPHSKGIAARVDPDWLKATASRTGIPRRALAAYAGAALRLARTQPECGIGWNTLAAIGFVESRHASYRGSTIARNGKVRPAIYGIALDGSSSAHIPDSDNGRFDQDATYDRAIGPMQLIPQSWRNWRADGNGDGRRDPQNIDDAVLAAAGYLCRAGEDLDTEDGWRDMIATYNSAPSYLAKVALQASVYGA